VLAAGAHLPVEDQPDAVGAAQVQVVADHVVEEHPPRPGGVEDLGQGELGLQDRQVVAKPGAAVGGGERVRQPRQPFAHERLDLRVGQAVADPLQPPRLGAGGEPVVQRCVRDPPLGGLPLGMLMPVDDHAAVVREVRPEFDHEGAEVGVDPVEVELVGYPLLAHQPRERRPGVGVAAFAGAPHPGLLLRHPDEHDPLVRGEVGQVLLGHVVLALPRDELDQVQAALVDEPVDRRHERPRDRGHHRPRRERQPPMTLEEPDHAQLPLQLGHVQVQVHPIDRLDLQRDVARQDISSGTR
jgi:hypothetical protein